MRVWILMFVTITVLLTVGMLTTKLKDEGVQLINITNSLEIMQNSLFNITENGITYINPYNESFTFSDFAQNTIHGVMYSVFVELNTLIGISVPWFYNHSDFMSMAFIIKWIIFLGLVWVVAKSIIPVGAIYVFYEDIFEKKKKQIKKYWILTFALMTWLVILGVLLLIGMQII